jgi:hypothetical protein
MKCIASEPREVPGFGVFEPGQVVDYDETLFASGIFEKVESDKKKGRDE